MLRALERWCVAQEYFQELFSESPRDVGILIELSALELHEAVRYLLHDGESDHLCKDADRLFAEKVAEISKGRSWREAVLAGFPPAADGKP